MVSAVIFHTSISCGKTLCVNVKYVVRIFLKHLICNANALRERERERERESMHGQTDSQRNMEGGGGNFRTSKNFKFIFHANTTKGHVNFSSSIHFILS